MNFKGTVLPSSTIPRLSIRHVTLLTLFVVFCAAVRGPFFHYFHRDILDIICSVLAECFALGCASRSVNYLDSFTLKPGIEDQVVPLIRPGRQKILQVQHVHFTHALDRERLRNPYKTGSGHDYVGRGYSSPRNYCKNKRLFIVRNEH